MLLCILLVSSARVQEPVKPLNNQDVIDMVALGLSDDLIVAKIRSMNGGDALKFDTSVDGLGSLKAARVPDAVMKAMINPNPPQPTVMAATAPMTMDPTLPPPEVGVYWKDGTKFVLIDGFALTQSKVGGRAGSFFTSGIRPEHWDATLAGSTSNNIVKDRRPQFTLSDDLNPGEYAFFMGTGAESNMMSGAASPGTGGSASGRVYDFSVPE